MIIFFQNNNSWLCFVRLFPGQIGVRKQSAFVRGRCIHDNYILVQQTIKLLHRYQVQSIFLKLDVSKAFESVSWAFLLEILVHLGFEQVWRNLVLNLLATSSTRVLLNGDPLDVIRRNQCLNFQILKFKFCKRSWMENYQNKSCRSQKVMKLCS